MINPVSMPDGIELEQEQCDRVNAIVDELRDLRSDVGNDSEYVGHINIAISSLAGGILSEHDRDAEWTEDIDWRDYQ